MKPREAKVFTVLGVMDVEGIVKFEKFSFSFQEERGKPMDTD